MLRPKQVAALEPLLPPRVTRLWQQLLFRVPRMEVLMGARMSDWVCSSPPVCDSAALLRTGHLTQSTQYLPPNSSRRLQLEIMSTHLA